MINIATIKTGVKGLVSVSGSISSGKRSWQGNQMAPEIMVAMFLSGTKTLEKKVLNDVLENAAINISFSIDNDYIRFSTVVARGHEKLFLDIITDILINSTFPSDEYEIIVGRFRAMVMESSTDPSDVAYRALTRAWFPLGTVQYKQNAKEMIQLLDTLTREEVLSAYNILVGHTSINIAIAGDVDKTLWQREVKTSFSKLPKKTHKSVPALATLSPSGGENINIKDKTSVSAFWAIPINIDVKSRRYLALVVLLRILGGDFVSRLMSEVREKRGLTYHISSGVQGVSCGDTGLLYIVADFAPVLHEKGVKATEEVLGNLFAKGIKPGELDRVRQAIAGEYEVRLATSSGMALELLNCLMLGRPLEYIDEYPKLIKSVTMKEVKEVLNSIKDSKFYRVSAGSI
ncbi:MAG TPA: pitrilysin family protein [Candidatus Paceibacterota bacterium]